MQSIRPHAAALLTGVVVATTPVAAATVTVTFERVTAKGGTMRAGLYNEEKFDSQEGDPLVTLRVPAVSPRTTVKFENVAPGAYAIKALQDENRNNRMDYFLFLPAEKFGFSNDAKPDLMRLKQPDFEKAKFLVGEKDVSLTIHLR